MGSVGSGVYRKGYLRWIEGTARRPVASPSVRTGNELVRIVVQEGTVLPGEPKAPPDLTTIELTQLGLVTLILGGRTLDLLRSGDLTIHGDRKAARLLLDTLASTAPIAAAQ